MRFYRINNLILLPALAFILLTIAGCKGRTTDTVEPSGETVEVIINQQPAETENSADNQADLSPESESEVL